MVDKSIGLCFSLYGILPAYSDTVTTGYLNAYAAE